MTKEIIIGLTLPFLGTALGAACALFMKGQLGHRLQRGLMAFAAGVMVAASIWSLLLPALDHAQELGVWSFVPATGGFWIGILFLLLLDKLIPHLHEGSTEAEGPHTRMRKSSMLTLAVTLHNLPEGMAVGVVLAALGRGDMGVTAAAAIALATGIAIQNFPEGAIISMPLRAQGKGRLHACGVGVLSGVVEPIGAGLTLLLARLLTPVLPWMLGFAAGAMLYVVVEELIPEAEQGDHSDLGVLMFGVGFSVMMTLDVVLG